MVEFVGFVKAHVLFNAPIFVLRCIFTAFMRVSVCFFGRNFDVCVCETIWHRAVAVNVMISKYNSTSTLNELIGKINSSHRWPFYAMRPASPPPSFIVCLLAMVKQFLCSQYHKSERKIEFCMSNFSQLAYDEHDELYTQTQTHTVTVRKEIFDDKVRKNAGGG